MRYITCEGMAKIALEGAYGHFSEGWTPDEQAINMFFDMCSDLDSVITNQDESVTGFNVSINPETAEGEMSMLCVVFDFNVAGFDHKFINLLDNATRFVISDGGGDSIKLTFRCPPLFKPVG